MPAVMDRCGGVPCLLVLVSLLVSPALSRRHLTFGTKSRPTSQPECADLEYDLSYLDDLFESGRGSAHARASPLTHMKLVHVRAETEVLHTLTPHNRQRLINGSRAIPKMMVGDKLQLYHEVRHMIKDCQDILRRTKVNLNRVKGHQKFLVTSLPANLKKEVYDIMRSVYDTELHTREVLSSMSGFGRSLYDARLACFQQHGNYSCPLPALTTTKHLRVLSWTWHHARADHEYEAARRAFGKVLSMARRDRDQLLELVKVKHADFLHGTGRRVADHRRLMSRTTRRLKRTANLLNRLHDRLRIIKRVHMQLHELTKDHRSMKSAVRNSKIGIDIANNNIRRIHGPLVVRLGQVRPEMHALRYGYLEQKKAYRLEMLTRMERHIVHLRDEAHTKLGPLHRPMRRARPYTELIENHANISTVVKGMDAKIKETERNLEEFRKLTDLFVKSQIKEIDGTDDTESGSGETDDDNTDDDYTTTDTWPTPTSTESTTVKSSSTKPATTPSTTKKPCDWWLGCPDEETSTPTKQTQTVPSSTKGPKLVTKSTIQPSSTKSGYSPSKTPQTTLKITTPTTSSTAKTTTTATTPSFTSIGTETESSTSTSVLQPSSTTVKTTTPCPWWKTCRTPKPKTVQSTSTTTSEPSSTTIKTKIKTTTPCPWWEVCDETPKPTTVQPTSTTTFKPSSTTIKTTIKTKIKTTTPCPWWEVCDETPKPTTVQPTSTTSLQPPSTTIKIKIKTTTPCPWWEVCDETPKPTTVQPKSTTTSKPSSTTIKTTIKTKIKTTTPCPWWDVCDEEPETPKPSSQQAPKSTKESTNNIDTTLETTSPTETTRSSTPTTTGTTTTKTTMTTTTSITSTTITPTTSPKQTSKTTMKSTKPESITTEDMATTPDSAVLKTTLPTTTKKSVTCHWWYGCPDEDETLLMDEPSQDSILTNEDKSAVRYENSEAQNEGGGWWWFGSDDGEEKKTKDKSTTPAAVSTKTEKSAVLHEDEKPQNDGGWWWSDDDDEEEEKAEEKTTTITTTTTTTETPTTSPLPTTPTPTQSSTRPRKSGSRSSRKKDNKPKKIKVNQKNKRLKTTTLPSTIESTRPTMPSIPTAEPQQVIDIDEEIVDEIVEEGPLPVTPKTPGVAPVVFDSGAETATDGCEDQEGSGGGGKQACLPTIDDSSQAARYLRSKLHESQGHSYKMLFDAKVVRNTVNDTGRRFQADRRDLYSEIQNFPQDQAVVARQLLPDLSTLKVSPKRTKNLDFKMEFLNTKSENLQQRLLAYETKLNFTRTRIAEVDKNTRESVPPSIEVAKTREQFGKIVKLDYDLGITSRRIKHLAESIEWNMAMMKRRVQRAQDIEKLLSPVVPLNDQTGMSGSLPPSLRAPAAVKTLSVMVKTNSESGSLLVLKDGGKAGGKGLAVGLRQGKPCVEWSGGRVRKRVKCDRPINDGNWHRLRITRSGAELVLEENPIADPDNVTGNSVSLPTMAMFDPLPQRMQLHPVSRRKRSFQACLSGLHVDGSYVVMETNISLTDLGLQSCPLLPVNVTSRPESLPPAPQHKNNTNKKCLPHDRNVIELSAEHDHISMISVSFNTKELKGAVLLYRTLAGDIWVLRLFRGHIMVEGTFKGERFLKFCFSPVPSIGKWHLFAVTMGRFTSDIHLDGHMCLSTKLRLLSLESGLTALSIYPRNRDIKNMAQRLLPSRTPITRYHGRLKDVMVNNRKISIAKEKTCRKSGAADGA